MEQERDIYRYKDLEAKGYGSRVTIWRKVKCGLFPSPVDDGTSHPIWLHEDIEAWKASLPHRHVEA
jgi:predicted DNA-binding transcriptional regulator AlpA